MDGRWAVVCRVQHWTVTVSSGSVAAVSAAVLSADVTDEASYPRLLSEVQQVVKGDGLNLLINNAGVVSNQPLHELDSEQMRHNFDINCLAPVMLTKVGTVFFSCIY